MCNDLAASARRMDEMPAHLALWPFHGHNRQRQDRRTTISRCKFNPGPPHCNIRAYADNLHSIISKSTRMALVGKCCATGTVMPQDTAHSRNLPHAASCDVTQYSGLPRTASFPCSNGLLWLHATQIAISILHRSN